MFMLKFRNYRTTVIADVVHNRNHSNIGALFSEEPIKSADAKHRVSTGFPNSALLAYETLKCLLDQLWMFLQHCVNFGCII